MWHCYHQFEPRQPSSRVVGEIASVVSFLSLTRPAQTHCGVKAVWNRVFLQWLATNEEQFEIKGVLSSLTEKRTHILTERVSWHLQNMEFFSILETEALWHCWTQQPNSAHLYNSNWEREREREKERETERESEGEGERERGREREREIIH